MEFKEIKKPTAKTNNLVIKELGDEVLVYDLDTHKAYNLNETSSFVWQNCDGKKGIVELSFALQKKANQPIKQEIVWLALSELKKEGLVDFEIETPNELAGLNRRKVIRKIGIASVITLPVITSLVAPTAAMAQSGGAPGTVDPGGVCQDDKDCRQVLGQPRRNCSVPDCNGTPFEGVNEPGNNNPLKCCG